MIDRDIIPLYPQGHFDKLIMERLNWHPELQATHTRETLVSRV